MNFELVTLESFTVAGITLYTDNSESGLNKINGHWGRFFHEGIMSKITKKKDDAVYEAYFDYSSDANGSYTLMLGGLIEPGESVPEGIEKKTMPKARYAKFQIGNAKEIRVTWEHIWGRTDLDRSYIGDFKIIRENGVELYIGLKAR